VGGVQHRRQLRRLGFQLEGLTMDMELPDFLTRNSYGEIRLTGHRIGLIHIVDRYNEGSSPEAILCAYPTLSPALISKVIAFYLDHQADIDSYVVATRQEIDRQAAAPSPGPTTVELRRRLESMRGDGRTDA
jgi:uncharacterized protein (DUF433 family)